MDQADVVLIADCVPFAYPDLHRDFLKDHAVLVACPKLDDFEAHLEKLTDILNKSKIKSLTVVHMEVPCCSGLTYMAKKAIEASGHEIPFKEVTIGIKGEKLQIQITNKKQIQKFRLRRTGGGQKLKVAVSYRYSVLISLSRS